MIRLNTDIIKERFINKHGDKYDYSLVKYVNFNTKVEIICKIHGSFFQRPNSHKNGAGCPKCVGVGITVEEKIKKLEKIHKEKYDYSYVRKLSNITNQTKIDIICPEHGKFNQRYVIHKNGCGCPKCGGSIPPTTEEYIKRLPDSFLKKYNYDKVIYESGAKNIIVTCKEHGDFLVTPRNHIKGNGCPKCVGRKLTNKDIIKEFNNIHKEKYDYSLVEYNRATTKVKIICPKHGIFEQTPSSHKNGSGCPKCKESRGETRIRLFLEYNNIEYKQELFIHSDKNKRTGSKFDFFLPDFNTFIEFDGIQHFKPISFFDGEEGFIKRKKKDIEKNEYCVRKKHNLIRIPYIFLNRIEDILNYKLGLK